MTYATTTLKANAEAIISDLGSSPTVKELTIASKAAQGLNCSNYSVLEAAIQAKIDAQTTSTPDTEIMLASLLVGATQAKTHTYFDTHTVTTSNSSYPIPANASRCWVSATSGGSGIYGGSVTEYEIGVSPGGTLNIVAGTNITVGNLQLRSAGTSGNVTVTFAGVVQPIGSLGVNTPVYGNRSTITLKFEIVEVVE
ncbi:hypothetical protein Q4503_10960 [Colwellia sp. 6_MG-2023]|uniref:hypothetical protein n=1 Tax=Colwellia sp. 6_MG-2023 TaxID=3062676 RepID=UPI0026E277E8|nr:hypothetical protein [Colwellia sp. 6_MG-2023]MDO6488223.1 hypothetical protein [Colwellia sp. 6_MG-2023]